MTDVSSAPGTATSAALREIATILDALGENKFRARAYARGADALDALPGPDELARLVEEGRLTDLPGVGEGLARVIGELANTGRSSLLETLRAQVPPAVVELASLKGLSLDKARTLHQALGVTSLDELEAAGREGRIRAVKGFGEKTEARLLVSIERRRQGLDDDKGQLRLIDALELSERLRTHLAPLGEVEVAGAVARCEESLGGLAFVLRTDDPRGAQERLLASPLVGRVEVKDERYARLRLFRGVTVELHTPDATTHAAALLRATAAPAHLAALEARAATLGLVLGAGCATEAELYGRLGLPWLPPEVREDGESIAAALAGDDFADLVTAQDVRGAVHCHTAWSDGTGTIEDMARAAEARGLEYLTITDHSAAAHYAGGLDADRLRAQRDELRQVQARTRVRLLAGTECDILPDGRLDVPDDLAAELDLVIASVHGRHRLDEAAQTARLVRAMEQPVFKVWGHPLGRLVLSRPPIGCRVEEVLDAAARSRAAIEVNGDPYRLDLPPPWLRAARRRGLRFTLSTDAHSPGGLDMLAFAVGTARRGWVRRGEVLNALPVEGFAAAVRPV